MARKKGSVSKRKKQQQFKMDSNIQFVLLILVGIITAALIYNKSGSMGIWFNDIFGGIFGILRFAVPAIPFIWAIYIASKHKETVIAKVVPVATLFLCSATLSSIIQMLNNVLAYNLSFSEVIDQAYYLGTKNKGGGVIGSTIAYPLAKLFSPIVALIIVIGIMIVVAVIVFKLKPSEKIGNYIDRKYEEKEQNRHDIEINPKKKSIIQEDLANQIEGRSETAKERKLREQEEKRKAALQVDDQLTINMMEDKENKNKD